MLIAFTVENFLSFAERQTLSMVPSLTDERFDHRLRVGNVDFLKTAVIYGANSSGKSNLIKAVAVGRDLIVNGLSCDYKNHYARTNLANRERSTLFEYTFYIEGLFLTYGIAIYLETAKLCGEWLYAIDPNDDQEQLIYERRPQSGIFDWACPEYKANKLNAYFKDDNIIFLRKFNNNDNLLKSSPGIAYKWFYDKLKVNIQSQPYTLLPYNFPEDRDDFFNIFGKFDTGINDIVLKEISFSALPSIVPKLDKKYTVRTMDGIYIVAGEEKKAYEIMLKHYQSDFLFRFNEESDGTKRLFDYVGVIIKPQNESVYFFDEIDRSIHPLLSRKFITVFNRRLKALPVQLVFTTHNAGLLSDEFFRRDEIWFVEKGDEGISKLFSLDIFKEKYRQPGEAYLRGDFGAIPILDKEDD